MKPPYDIVIIGAGIVGLATAQKYLSQHPGKRLLVLDKEDRLAAHQTGRNSGVIHSGIYYKPGSLKATNCRDGYHQLVAFCQKHDIPHEICGKLIVATREDELPRLEALHQRAQANGLENVTRLSAEQIADYEPHATGIAALRVPQTGIVDYHALCRALAQEITAAGGTIQLQTRLLEIVESNDQLVLETSQGTIAAKQLCTCAGLHSDRLARQTDPEISLRIIPFRGEYYELTPEAQHLVKHLIYPVPDPAFPFLGVHFTRMTSGGIEAGPNAVLALAREGYTWSDINLRDLLDTFAWPGFWTLAKRHWRMGSDEIVRSLSKKAFTHALQRLIPEIQESDLHTAPSGVRAQACHSDGSLLDDFHFEQHRRILHVCNAPSPAATAALSIADSIVEQMQK
ncbi:L-2-hydroxyglutarate oxidase [Pelagicoccus enzymogenes]|uniref:L-2-hydroxyglutarate oxidase n=1 Tax=Pelagicoccus enzymogenes TaxID=2773457 RepID=UPI00280FBFE8|nr:L-2-hydroxyglutarate oxidase [Pelagicoccus enzymogenes]MDQ8199183.1 L-2-hydroxyglutarate oxidase [Pelagicoccus enzymogenes]